MQTVKYIDSYSHGTLHEQYNAAMFLVVNASFDNVTYYSGESSLNCASKLIETYESTKFKSRKIFVVGGNGKIGLLLRIVVSCLQNIRFLLFSKKDTVLIYNFNNFLSLWFLNVLNKVLNRKVIVFSHSEISFLVNESAHDNLIYKLRTKILRYVFLNPKCKLSTNIYFAVLGDSIIQNLSKILSPEKFSHFISVEHPYIFKKSIPSVTHRGLKLGVVGTMAQEKGANILTEIANSLDLINRKDISISIIGRILCDTKQFQDVGILLPSNLGKTALSREEFNSKIEELDFILYLYPVNSYKFTASGSLMDSINLERPALSFRNDYFNYIFNKYGSFGYLVENSSEMVSLINSLANTVTCVDNFNFQKIKKSLSPLSITRDFVDKLKTLGIDQKC